MIVCVPDSWRRLKIELKWEVYKKYNSLMDSLFHAGVSFWMPSRPHDGTLEAFLKQTGLFAFLYMDFCGIPALLTLQKLLTNYHTLYPVKLLLS